MPDSQSSFLFDIVEALRSREWRTIRRLLLSLSVAAAPILFQYRGVLGAYQVYGWIVVGVLFIALLAGEIFSRRSPSQPVLGNYTRTIRGLVSFGEDDAAAFAGLGRARDISRVVTALLNPDYRLGILFAESGCGKTSLLRAGVQPELKRLGYTLHIDDINNQEDPLHLIARLLRGSPGAEVKDADPAKDPESARTPLTGFDSAARPVFLILDQFEQFFLHYGRPEQAEPFLAILEDWWTRHPASQLRVLLAIREDYVGKLAQVQERLQYIQTIHNHLRLRKFTPDDAVEILRSMAADSALIFHEPAVRRTCREELASKEDGMISPVDLQILATGVRDLRDSPGFTAESLRSLGGLEGALERYLSAQLETWPSERKVALAILRILSEFKQGVLVGWRSTAEIEEALHSEFGAERVAKTIQWLANPGVRLIVENQAGEAKTYRLVHDRLVDAVRRVSGQVLESAGRANILLEQRADEYVRNLRNSRFLLPWKEWRFISRNLALVDWGNQEANKRELLLRSARRIKARVIAASAFVLVGMAGLAGWQVYLRTETYAVNSMVGRAPLEAVVENSRDEAAVAYLEALVVSGKLEAALTSVAALRYTELKTWGLGIIAVSSAKAGRFADADNTALKVSEEGDRQKILGDIIKAECVLRSFSDADRTVQKIGDPKERDSKIEDILEAEGKAGNFEAARTSSARLGDPSRRTVVLSELQIKSGDFASALRIAQQISDREKRSSTIGDIAEAQAQAVKIEDAESTLAQVEEPSDRTSAMDVIAVALIGAARPAEAVAMWENARKEAHLVPNFETYYLSQIADHEAKARKVDEAAKCWVDAVEAVRNVRDASSRFNSLLRIGRAQRAAGKIEDAVRTFSEAELSANQTGTSSSDNLRQLVQEQVYMKRFADAHRIALTISISLGQQQALMTVVTSLARSGQVEQALMFARQASLVEDRLPLLLAIAVEQMRAHKVDEARNTFGEAKRAVQATKAPQLWSAVVEDEAKAGEFEGAEEDTKEIPTGNREAELAKLVEFEAGAGKFQMALRTAEMIGSEQSRSQAFYVISNLQAKAGDFQTAMRAAERVPNRFTKSLAVTNVIGWQLKNGKAVDVSGAILGLSDAKSRSAAFRKVAEAQVKLGKFTEAQNGLREALKASRQIEDNEDRATAIREVGEAQFQAGMVADGKSALLEAARAAEQVSGSRDHIDAIFESAIDLAHVGFYRDALRAADLCPPRYTLAVYATVLLERAKKSDPRLQEFKPIQDFLPTAFQSSANGTLAK